MTTRLLAASCFFFSLLISFSLPVTSRAGAIRVPLDWRVDTENFFGARGPNRDSKVSPTFTLGRFSTEAVLPYRIVTVALPQGERIASIDVLPRATWDAQKSRQALSEIAASVPSIDEALPVDFRIDHAMTNGMKATVVAARTFHGYRLADIAVMPIARASDGSGLRLITELDLQIQCEPDPDRTQAVGRVRHIEGFRDRVGRRAKALVANPSMIDRYSFGEIMVDEPPGFSPTYAPSLEGSPVSMVIVTVEEFAAECQRLADFRTARGIPTVVRTFEWIEDHYRGGSDGAETIRHFLQDAYANWGIEWVLLAGDTEILPSRYAFSTYNGGDFAVTDFYFSCLDGTWNGDGDAIWGEATTGPSDPGDDIDLYPEVNVGRFPAKDLSDLAVLIDKTLNYEEQGATDYQDKVLMLAEVLHPISWKSGDPIILNGATLTEVSYATDLSPKPLDITRMYETESLYPGSVHESHQATLDSMQAGTNFICHVGHGFRYNISVGDKSIVNSEADALYHPDRFFVLYMLNCTALEFDFFCLGEHLLLNPDGGAAACVGSSNLAFPNVSFFYMSNFIRLAYTDGVVRLGEVLADSRLPQTPGAAVDGVDRWTHFILNMLGDPALRLWTGGLEDLSVVQPSFVSTGENSITISVSDAAGPVESATVTLWKGEEDYQTGLTDGAGEASFTFKPESSGKVLLTVTALNHSNYVDSIDVFTLATPNVIVPPSGFLSVVDDGSGSTSGNGDGAVDAGETIEFTVVAANAGGTKTGNKVVGTMTSADPGVSILDDQAEWDRLSPGQSLASNDPFVVRFDTALTDQDVVEFEIQFDETGPGLWTDRFRTVVHAPLLDLVVNAVADSAPLGDGDGVIDQGETFRLDFRIRNYGTGTASGLTGSLASLDADVTVLSGADTYPAIPQLETRSGISGFLVSESDTASENALVFQLTDQFGRTWSRVVELRGPAMPTGVVLDPGLGEDRIGASWIPSPESDLSGYRVYRADSLAGPYQIVTADLIPHSRFVDVGLAALTSYAYRISAVDSSGNESALSPPEVVSTNPVMLMGWPITLGLETASSPAVGDIDGDDDLEIVVGSKNYLHAWHADGIEMLDGDGDPQSWGVLSTDGFNYTASPCLADLVPGDGLEIIAASWDTREIYVFDSSGQPLPGWPRSTVNVLWPTPTVGDLDGDGDLEVVAADGNGTLYAWHHDGNEYIDGDSNPATQGIFFDALPHVFNNSSPAIGDLTFDGDLEIVFAAQNDSLYVLNGSDGSHESGWPRFLAPGAIFSASPVLADVDNDGDREILLHQSWTAKMWLFEHDGSLYPGFVRFIQSNIEFNSSPALADFDGDGNLEIVVASTNGNLYVIDKTGSIVPGWPVAYGSTSQCSPVLSDFDGDGLIEILFGDEDGFLHCYHQDGSPQEGFPIKVADAVRSTPVVIDTDQDGDVEIVVASWDRSVYIWDLPYAYDEDAMVWPTFRGDMKRRGVVGDDPTSTGTGAAAISADAVTGGVHLAWSSATGGSWNWTVMRARGEGNSFTMVAASVRADGGGHARFFDDDVVEGETYFYRVERIDDGLTLETGAVYVPVRAARLDPNAPNPFNPVTRIRFAIPDGPTDAREVRVKLRVFDARGALVRTLVDGFLPAGAHTVTWRGVDDRGRSVASGLYFYRLEAGAFQAARKMLLLK